MFLERNDQEAKETDCTRNHERTLWSKNANSMSSNNFIGVNTSPHHCLLSLVFQQCGAICH